jgi:hypothetical protein
MTALERLADLIRVHGKAVPGSKTAMTLEIADDAGDFTLILQANGKILHTDYFSDSFHPTEENAANLLEWIIENNVLDSVEPSLRTEE